MKTFTETELKDFIRNDEMNKDYTEEQIQERFDYLNKIKHYYDCKCEWCI